MHVAFGELIPKHLAIQSADRTALLLATPLVVFARLTRPLTLLMSGTANLVIRFLGYEPTRGEEMVHSVEELLLLIEDTEEAGILAKHDFGDGRARYEETPEEHHDHLIDIQSGKVVEFHNDEIEELQRRIAEKAGYKLVGHRLELYGVPLDGKTDRQK